MDGGEAITGECFFNEAVSAVSVDSIHSPTVIRGRPFLRLLAYNVHRFGDLSLTSRWLADRTRVMVFASYMRMGHGTCASKSEEYGRRAVTSSA